MDPLERISLIAFEIRVVMVVFLIAPLIYVNCKAFPLPLRTPVKWLWLRACNYMKGNQNGSFVPRLLFFDIDLLVFNFLGLDLNHYAERRQS